jgi:hypothetical protein
MRTDTVCRVGATWLLSTGFYETVAFVLERHGVGWRIAKRTQLGIT